ncbi:unnamed protein product [Blepharisma stoltei]|uniref:LITAF domain-containing protein n=1 Tax=Blepharisma stoltei TaxID=1481888 RepID=A0AAU9JHI7_9CILI|nr:unnamed protein product [Blepharisma stoltei]
MESNCMFHSFEVAPDLEPGHRSSLFSYKGYADDSHEIGLRKSETRYHGREPSIFDVKISLPSPVSKEGFSVDAIMPSPPLNRTRRSVGRILTYSAYENPHSKHFRTLKRPKTHKRSPSSYANSEVTSKEILAALPKPRFMTRNSHGHIREISDVSNVVITSQDSDIFETLHTRSDKSSHKKSVLSQLSTDFSMGPSSCMTFCSNCKTLVYSQISYEGNGLGSSIFRAFQKICCKAPEFIRNQVVHKCPECGSVLGKI